MDEKHRSLSDSKHHTLAKSGVPQSIEWYSPGQARVFEVDGVRIAVRFVGRRGRRGRIAVATACGANARHFVSKGVPHE
ncbi:MAG: hypothetical protein WEB58_11400 [Planctomycetaceae bacterium]